jgi:hypothetical protein
MTMKLEAPYPSLTTTTILPNPDFGNSKALTSTLMSKRATDGTQYTYIKRSERKKLLFPLTLTRPKALELRAFFNVFSADRIRLTDHDDNVWIGHFTSNPVDFTTDRKAGPSCGTVKGESVSVTLEFEGELQS